ncbi:MAG: phosphatidate cytidylyltransferase, partial [Aestuariivirgaceae bacterium]
MRIAAAAVMIPCVLAVTWLGGVWFAALIVVVGVAAAVEWTRIALDGSRVQLLLHALAVVIAALFSVWFSLLPALAFVAFVWSASLVFMVAGDRKLSFTSFFSVPYIAVPIAALVHLRVSSDLGLIAIFWIFA